MYLVGLYLSDRNSDDQADADHGPRPVLGKLRECHRRGAQEVDGHASCQIAEAPSRRLLRLSEDEAFDMAQDQRDADADIREASGDVQRAGISKPRGANVRACILDRQRRIERDGAAIEDRGDIDDVESNRRRCVYPWHEVLSECDAIRHGQEQE